MTLEKYKINASESLTKNQLHQTSLAKMKNLKVLMLDQLVKLHLCKLGHMISHKQLPTRFTTCSNQREEEKPIATRPGANIFLTYKSIRLKSLINVYVQKSDGIQLTTTVPKSKHPLQVLCENL